MGQQPAQGQVLLAASETCAAASAQGAGRLIVVDPINDNARGFSSHFGFVEAKPPGGRMVMRVATAKAALQA